LGEMRSDGNSGTLRARSLARALLESLREIPSRPIDLISRLRRALPPRARPGCHTLKASSVLGRLVVPVRKMTTAEAFFRFSRGKVGARFFAFA